MTSIATATFNTEEVLERAASDGFIDPKAWLGALDEIVTRIDQIAIHEFPTPVVLTTSLGIETTQGGESPETGSSRNVTPSQIARSNGPPSSPPEQSDPNSSLQEQSSSSTLNTIKAPEGTLPPSILATMDYVKNTLRSQFAEHPPHTIQRLAELILRPKRQYRFVGPWTRALDRVVSVTSNADVFPLPVESRSGKHPSLNGVPSTPSNKGSKDEGLGGALLTPIPWLHANQRGTEVESPPSNRYNMSYNADAQGDSEDTDMEGYDDDRKDEAVTQGELLRQEQEASDPPAPVTSDDYHQPHVRGPEDIGMEDLGPQNHAGGLGAQVLDIQAAVGRPVNSPERESKSAANKAATRHKKKLLGGKEFGDKDIEVTDVDGLIDEELDKMDVQGDTSSP